MEKQRPRSPQTAPTESSKSSQSDSSAKDWFQADLTRRSANKRIGKGLAWAAGLGMVGLTGYKIFSSDDNEINLDSHDLQAKEGWNVGAKDRSLSYDPTYTVATTSTAADWNQYTDSNKLIAAYQPKDSKWQPYFVPTLTQPLSDATLKQQVKPVKTTLMEQTYGQAEAVKELLTQSANANESLIVAELDGIHSVAFGAAMSDFANIIPVFDNWPHPLGVVRSHETLGAMIYYANEVETNKAKVKDNAPAVILLDAQRLNPYTDEENQFDNRYMAKLPSAADLKQRGITSLTYVVKDDSRKEELDDLNDEFVELEKQGIPIRFLKLSDFKLSNDPVPDNAQIANNTGTPNTVVRNHYYYGGSPLMHWWFYQHYYYTPHPYAYTTYGGTRYNYSRPTTPAPFTPPAYRPVSRPTIFSGTRVGGTNGVGRSRPSGFGRTSVRMSSDGRVTGVRSGRSGSYGRSGGSWFGG